MIDCSRVSRILAAGVVLGALALSLLFAAYVAISDTPVRIQYMPDDAFYYMTLARNYATFHSWTFDSGVSSTTGFHLLHAYFLSFLYTVASPSLDGFVTITIGLGLGLSLVSGLLGVFACCSSGLIGGLTLALFFMSRNFMLNSVGGMEWGWVAVTASLYCFTLCRPRAGSAFGMVWPIFVVGILGSLASSLLKNS